MIDLVLSGSIALAAPVAFLAGIVSFLSPCVLPLVPGYLSYATGLSASSLAEPTRAQRRKILLGTSLFIVGFGLVFISYGALFGGLGSRLARDQVLIDRILGVFMILMGLIFAGWLPMVRQWRMRIPTTLGLGGAPLLGILFGFGWTPCIGPTLAAVQALAFTESSAMRGAFLGFVYCLGLGLPFLVVGLLIQKSMRGLAILRRHLRLITALGGGLLIVVGVLLLTGVWSQWVLDMRSLIGGFTPAL
jgi:cytochrome c-type biogenesis protein